MRVEDGLLPSPRTTSITITAERGTAWSATAQYATSTATEWGINANGQTFGIPNINGVPDLTPARASNGEVEYVYSVELTTTENEGFISADESDGTTIVGQQPFQIVDDIPVDVTTMPRLAAGDGDNR